MAEWSSATQSRPLVTHRQEGERTLITLEVPRDAIVSGRAVGLVGVELDEQHWYEAAKTVLRIYNLIYRVMEADHLIRRLSCVLREGVERALAGEADPELHRRRAVANVLHRLADAVLNGAAQEIQLAWNNQDLPQKIELDIRTPHRRFSETLVLTLRPTEDGADRE